MVAPQTELELPGHTEWLKDKYWGELSGGTQAPSGSLEAWRVQDTTCSTLPLPTTTLRGSSYMF